MPKCTPWLRQCAFNVEDSSKTKSRGFGLDLNLEDAGLGLDALAFIVSLEATRPTCSLKRCWRILLVANKDLDEILSVNSQKIIQILPPLHFKAKMHQIQFPLGLSPRPRWES